MWGVQHREGETVGLFRFVTGGNWKMVGTCLLGKISAESSEARVSGAIAYQCSLVLSYWLEQKELWKSPCLDETNHAKITLYGNTLYKEEEDCWDFLISRLPSACSPPGVRAALCPGRRTPGHLQKTCSAWEWATAKSANCSWTGWVASELAV